MVSDWVLHFWKGSKNAFKKNNFCRFLHFFPKRIFASTSTAIFSVIYCARQLLFTIFIKFKQKSFRIWFQIGSYIFGRGQKMHLKKTTFGVCLHQQSCNISVIWPLIRKIRTLYFLQLLKLQEIKCP